MKRITVMVLAVLVGFAMVCSAGAADDAQRLLDAAPYTEEGLLSIVKDPKNVTAVEFEALLLARTKADVNNEGLDIDYDSPAFKALAKVHKDYKLPEQPSQKEVYARFLKHPDPKVRMYPYTQMHTLLGTNKEDQSTVVEALKTETDQMVLCAAIKAVANEVSNPEIAKIIFANAKNENPLVRRQAAWALANPWSKSVDGVVDAVIALMADDDEKVSAAACGGAGRLETDKVVEPLAKILADPSRVKIHAKAMEGLYWRWYDFPTHKSTSEGAYKASVAYLSKKPRTKDIPAWNSIGALKTVNDKDIEEWKTKASYFKADEYCAVMADIAKDGEANWIARTAAIEVIAKWGDKTDLEKLKNDLSGDASQNAKQVMAVLDKAIEKAK
jgi:HEAT repeat protein